MSKRKVRVKSSKRPTFLQWVWGRNHLKNIENDLQTTCENMLEVFEELEDSLASEVEFTEDFVAKDLRTLRSVGKDARRCLGDILLFDRLLLEQRFLKLSEMAADKTELSWCRLFPDHYFVC